MTPSSLPARPYGRLTVVALILAITAAVWTVAVMVGASGLVQDDSDGSPSALLIALVFVLVNLVPHALLTWLLVNRRRDSRPVRLTLLIGTLVFVAFDALLLVSFLVSDSSTAALVFVTLPLVLGIVLVGTGLAVLICRWLVRRRAA